MIKIFFSDEQIIKYLQEQGYIVKKKEDQIKYAQEARAYRSARIQEKIQKAIEELKRKNKPISANAVAKEVNINWRTAQKYLKKMLKEE